MAYAFTNSKGVTYYLHTKKSTTSTGKERTLFFFSKEVKDGTLDSVPDGYKVVEMKTACPSSRRQEVTRKRWVWKKLRKEHLKQQVSKHVEVWMDR
jgi:hypothetical protein